MKGSRNNTRPKSPSSASPRDTRAYTHVHTLKLIISVGVRDKEGGAWRNGNSGMEYGGARQKLKREMGRKSTRKAAWKRHEERNGGSAESRREFA